MIYFWLRYHKDCVFKFWIWLLKLLTFSVYIRKFIESFLFLSISSSQELSKLKTHSKSEIISFWFSLAILLFLWLTSILLMTFHSKSMKSDFNVRKFWVKEFYEGFKMTHFSKLYFFMFTMRRIVLTSWIFFGDSLSKTARVCVFAALQLPSLSYTIMCRPYSETKENLWESINEIMYLLLCLFLWFVNSESTWTATMAYIVIWTLTINSLVIMLIIFIWTVKFLFWSPKSPLRCKTKEQAEQQEEAKVAPKSQISKHNLSNLTGLSNHQIRGEESKDKQEEFDKNESQVYIRRRIYLRNI